MSKYLTVVYVMHDTEDCKEKVNKIFKNMADPTGESLDVVAVSSDHEIRRLEWYETASAEIHDAYELKEVLENIAGHQDITTVETLDEMY